MSVNNANFSIHKENENDKISPFMFISDKVTFFIHVKSDLTFV